MSSRFTVMPSIIDCGRVEKAVSSKERTRIYRESKEGTTNVFSDELTGIHLAVATVTRLVVSKEKKRHILQTGGATVGETAVCNELIDAHHRAGS